MEYMKAGELKKVLENIPDDAKVYYERIEDEYFEEHGWKPVKLKSDPWYDRCGLQTFEDEIAIDVHAYIEDDTSDWIEVYEVFYNKEENAVKITAHY